MARTNKRRNTGMFYEFAVEVTGLDLDNPDQINAFETQSSDTTLLLPAQRGRKTLIGCSVKENAITSAIRALNQTITQIGGITLKRVEPDLVNMQAIADEIGVKRQTVHSWMRKGTNNFPPEYAMIESGERPMPVWVRGDIHQWALETKYCDAVDPEYHSLTSDEVLEADTEIEKNLTVAACQ